MEPFYVISLEEIFWGIILIASTMTIHGLGMLLVLRVNYTLKKWLGRKDTLIAGLFPVVVASCMILTVHLTEVFVWSLFFILKGILPSYSSAYDFALNGYTTIGNPFRLPEHWRLLNGLLAISGLLAFAWSTGILFTLAQQFQNQRMDNFRKRESEKSSAKDTA